jgi:glutaredoxin 3
MAAVEIYTRSMCAFCYRAKKLLDSKGVAYTEYDIWAESGRKEEMTTRAPGASTVPQIFVDGEHVGGCDDLYAEESSGALDKRLNAAA